jgi:hypothetical protein
MSQSSQSPRNGLAKLLSEADPDAPLGEVAAEKDEFECPACGWTAELQRNECMVCEYGQSLRSARSDTRGGA